MLSANAIQVMVDGGLDAAAILSVARLIENPEPVQLSLSEGRGPISRIQAAVANHYGVSLADMASHRRARDVARPRQVAMYLAKELTDKSLPTIGAAFNRDHTTVMHSIRVVEARIECEGEVAADVGMIRRMLLPSDERRAA